MRHLLEKARKIDFPTFTVQGKQRVLPPILFQGSASYGPTVIETNKLHNHQECIDDARATTKAALEVGYRIFINGGAGFFFSIMHHQGEPSIGPGALNITNTTPHIAQFEGALPGIDLMLVAKKHLFSLRKALFGIAGVEVTNRGASGTVDEFVDTILRMAYGEMSPNKPLAFNNRHNFYDSIFAQLQQSADYGYLPADFLKRLIIGQNGPDLIMATKDRLMSLTDEEFHSATHYRPQYRQKELVIERSGGPYNKKRRAWVPGSFKAPVIALVTGRSVDEDPKKRNKRHALTEKIDVDAIIKGIKSVTPNAVILFIDEESHLAKRIHDTAKLYNLRTLGISSASHTRRAMFGMGTTKIAENSSLINSAIIDMADVIVPMDLSLRAQSVFWQSIVYVVTREPSFLGKEVIPFNKSGIYDHTEAMIDVMIAAGLITPGVRDIYYAGVKDEGSLVGAISQIYDCKGKRLGIEPYPPAPAFKLTHIAKPPDDRVIVLSPGTVVQVASLVQPPRDGKMGRHLKGIAKRQQSEAGLRSLIMAQQTR